MMIIPTPTVEEEILSLESMVSWLWKLSKVKAFITKMLSLENLGWTPLMVSVLANGRQDFNPGLLSLKHFSLDYIIEYVIYSTTLNKKFVYWKKIDYNTRFFSHFSVITKAARRMFIELIPHAKCFQLYEVIISPNKPVKHPRVIDEDTEVQRI